MNEPPALTFSVELAPHEVPEAAAYQSSQIGCSELAPLMVALGTWEGVPEDVAAWCKASAERAAHRGSVKSLPDRLKHPTLSPVWCADRCKPVRTVVGPLPEIIASKSGARERPEQESYQKLGLDLEPLLWRAWLATLRADPDCVLEVDTARSQHDVLGLYPAAWNMRAPSKRHPTLSRLVTYMDGWIADVAGEWLVVNCKLSRENKYAPDGPAWIQMQGEIGCCETDGGILVYGEKWSADYMREPPEERPVRAFHVELHAGAQAAIARTHDAAWERVEKIRDDMKKGRVTE